MWIETIPEVAEMSKGRNGMGQENRGDFGANTSTLPFLSPFLACSASIVT
jgi:hypothetical protein